MEQVIELVVASNNKGKLREISSLIANVTLLSLDDIGYQGEIDEPFHSFEENALAKAQAIHQFSGKKVFADDSGICVEALNGAPGVNSAYFGGLPRSDAKNNDKLLYSLEGKENRNAFYKAVICLIWNDQPFFFEGICKGRIAESPRGENGFGYDPLFIPEGYEQTFGELALDIKNSISHRGKAVTKLVEFLNMQIKAL
jgi:XTP/dITP diphosphohydrolase